MLNAVLARAIFGPPVPAVPRVSGTSVAGMEDGAGTDDRAPAGLRHEAVWLLLAACMVAMVVIAMTPGLLARRAARAAAAASASASLVAAVTSLPPAAPAPSDVPQPMPSADPTPAAFH
jgi:hypothetical protein